ncbi:MAG: exodeoxyribonuclease VII large subunit [Bryobacteraceae bacterium]|jgi:exodeoxyribonuclease VII large subunit
MTTPPSEESVPAGVYSVASLTGEIHRMLSRSFDDIKVAGEISGWKVWTSGHAYFTLKDQQAQIRCVLFRNNLRYLRFKPQDGAAVIARGSVEVRAERGEYQLLVSGMEPQGLGRLYEMFAELKEKLRGEGLFDESRKRPLPVFPRRIGIVTSPQGAVIRDMLTVLRRRWPGLHIRLYPTPVQGAGSAEGIVEGLDWFSASGWPDVVIVGRGGGSLEDLWSFNDERVARAIAASRVPVVSAVGHETDFTIADFVADVRAPTPSAAAEIVVLERSEVLGRVERAQQRTLRAIGFRLAQLARRLDRQGVERTTRLLELRINRMQQRADELDFSFRTRIARILSLRRERLRALDARLRERDLSVRLAKAGERWRAGSRALGEAVARRLGLAQRRLEPLAGRLEALSPMKVLERGYSIVQTEDGRVVKRANDAPEGASIRVRLHEGRLTALVRESRRD